VIEIRITGLEDLYKIIRLFNELDEKKISDLAKVLNDSTAKLINAERKDTENASTGSN
jgi:hypothetical protein